MNQVLEFLAGSLFRYFLFPLLSVVAGVALKFVSRNDQYATFTKEDFAVGLELLLTACLLYIGLTAERVVTLRKAEQELSEAREASLLVNQAESSSDVAKNYLSEQVNELTAQTQTLFDQILFAFLVVLLLVVGLWSASTVVRKWGWRSQTEMKPLFGIAVPIMLGLFALATVMALGTG